MSNPKTIKNTDVNTDVAQAEAAVDNQDLKAEFEALKKEFQVLVAQAGNAGQAAKGAATSAVRAQAAKGVEVGEHYASELADEWREIDRKVVRATQESPWRTLGVAGLVGLVLGLILRR